MVAVVAAGLVRLHLPMSHSLKDKRQVLRSLQSRIRDQFGVSIAETGAQDVWQTAELTIAVAASDAVHARATLEKIADFIDAFHLPVEIVSTESELIYF
jgi:uncharacterized protein YlxP (DUF503 family)